MEEFIAYLVKNMVSHPEEVEVLSTTNEEGLVMEIKVASDDVGKVVGRQGSVIRSLRTLAISIGARFGQKVRLEVLQPE